MLWLLIPAAVVAVVGLVSASGDGDSGGEEGRQAAIDKARREEAERSRAAFRQDTVKQAGERLLALAAAHPDVFEAGRQASGSMEHDTLERWFRRSFDTPEKALANLSEIFPATRFSDQWKERGRRIAEAEREIGELKTLRKKLEDTVP